MTESWVLILYMLVAGAISAPTNLDFDSSERCKHAGEQWVQASSAGRYACIRVHTKKATKAARDFEHGK